MEHHFNTDIAKDYGIEEAIILYNLFFWINKNAANGINFQDGSYWTYNSVTGYAKIFPYIHEKKIKRVIAFLVDKGLIKKGNFNENKMLHTNWYAFTEKGLEYLERHGYKMSRTIGTNCTNRTVQNEPNDYTNLSQSNKDKKQDNNKLTNVSKTPTKKPVLDYSFIEDAYKDVFRTWLIYKRDTFKETYKTQQSLQAAYNRLKKLSGNSPVMAREIVEQSMANNWKGLFELKTINNQIYGDNRANTEKEQRAREVAEAISRRLAEDEADQA